MSRVLCPGDEEGEQLRDLKKCQKLGKELSFNECRKLINIQHREIKCEVFKTLNELSFYLLIGFQPEANQENIKYARIPTKLIQALASFFTDQINRKHN